MSQKGQIQVLIVVLVVGLLALGGYLVYTNYSNNRIKLPAATQFTPQPSPSPTDLTANWKKYTNNELHFSFKYPANLKLTESKSTSRSNYQDKVTFLNLSAGSLQFNLSFEPNPKNLTIDKWLLERIEQERLECEIDCPGFSNPTERLIVAKKEAVFQELGSVVPSINIYLPLDNKTVIWASAINPPKMVPTEEDKKLLISILDTFKFTN